MTTVFHDGVGVKFDAISKYFTLMDSTEASLVIPIEIDNDFNFSFRYFSVHFCSFVVTPSNENALRTRVPSIDKGIWYNSPTFSVSFHS